MSENIFSERMRRNHVAWQCLGIVAMVYSAGVTVILGCVVFAGR